MIVDHTPPEAALPGLLCTAMLLGGVLDLSVEGMKDSWFYEPDSDTSHWIGVFNIENSECGIASILSVAHHFQGEQKGWLSPCAVGDAACTYLLNILRTDGIQACFRAAEAMAIASNLHQFWGMTIRIEEVA